MSSCDSTHARQLVHAGQRELGASIVMVKGQVYQLAQVHFHWVSDSYEGSEQKINGESSAMEAHFVHFRQDLGSVSSAVDVPEGLLVIGATIMSSSAV